MTRLSGIPELIEDRVEGHLAEPANPDSLAEAIASVLADPEGARVMASRARDKVRRQHELRTQVGELAEAFRAIAGGEVRGR